MASSSGQDAGLRHLALMGIPVWARRRPTAGRGTALPPGEEGPDRAAAPVPAATAAVPAAHRDGGVATLGWEALAERVAVCTACELHRTRTQTVFGTGDRDADWMFVGEAPGADEDRQGEPFVGRAGQLLTAMIEALGLRREQVYIGNTLKCRPPRNRDPLPEEVVRCRPFLERQIALVQPRVIVALGRIAAHNLLGVETPLARLRGRVHRLAAGTPVIVTYHPAFLLRSPREKRRAWEDLCLARRVARGEPT